MSTAATPKRATKALKSVTQARSVMLGTYTTRELLEELRMRGDLLFLECPTTEAGTDGGILSGSATALLRALTPATLRRLAKR
jgi:hypothetical protein